MTISITPQAVTYGRDASMATFSVKRYHKMIEAGILSGDDKVELLENYVGLKMPRNPPHDGTIDLLKAALPAASPRAGCSVSSKPSSCQTASPSPTSPSFAGSRGPF